MQQFLETDSDGRVRVIIDQRESERFDIILGSLGATVERRTLSVGDFLCSAKLAIERKTRSDFEQSIIDGRLFSQLPNLITNYERVVIIVEGESDERRLSRNALLGTYATIISDYGSSLIFTRDMEATAEIVYHFAKHEQLAKKQPMRIYAKRKTLTPSQSARAIAETFPMIGPKVAKELLKHFGSVARIANATEHELAEVEGVGPKRAKVIRAILSYEYDPDKDK